MLIAKRECFVEWVIGIKMNIKTENEEWESEKYGNKSLSNEKKNLRSLVEKKRRERKNAIVLRRHIQQVGNRRLQCMCPCTVWAVRWVHSMCVGKYSKNEFKIYTYTNTYYIKCASYIAVMAMTRRCACVSVYDAASSEGEQKIK